MLASTGLLLLKTDDYGFGQAPTPIWIVKNVYDVEVSQEDVRGIELNGQWWSVLHGHLYRNDQWVKKISEPILGGVETDFGFALLQEQGLLLFTSVGELVDQLKLGEGLPMDEALLSLQHINGTFWIQTQRDWWQSEDLFEWQTSNTPEFSHTMTPLGKPPLMYTTKIVEWQLGHSIPMERFLLDLHSGRVLGDFGVMLMEWSAWGLLFLTASGLWVFTVKFSKGHQQRKRIRLRLKQRLKQKALYLKN